MRVPVALLLVLAAACVVSAGEIAVVRVWPGYRTAASFDRISEYFSNKEEASAHGILRSQPAERAGYYFLVRLKNAGPEVAGARAELQVITPFSPETRTYTFPLTVPAGSRVFYFGLTGTDWPDQPKAEVVAWQLRLLNADGAELAKEQSYLWALPPAK